MLNKMFCNASSPILNKLLAYLPLFFSFIKTFRVIFVLISLVRIARDKARAGNNINLNSPEVQHDLALLGFDISEQSQLSPEILKKAFIKSRVWNWFIGKLNSKENKEFYFGELTESLHSSFLDDPAPYRKRICPNRSFRLNRRAIMEAAAAALPEGYEGKKGGGNFQYFIR